MVAFIALTLKLPVVVTLEPVTSASECAVFLERAAVAVTPIKAPDAPVAYVLANVVVDAANTCAVAASITEPPLTVELTLVEMIASASDPATARPPATANPVAVAFAIEVALP